MDEKRGASRFKINQMIGYYSNREEYLWAEGLNISRGGLTCSSKEPVDPMTNVFLMLDLPGPEGKRLVKCEGYVAHSRMEGGKCLFGIRIVRIPEEDQLLIDAYMDRLEKEGEEDPPVEPAGPN